MNKIQKLALTTVFAFSAMLAFNCSSGGDGDNDNGENTSNGGNFSVNSEIYDSEGNPFVGSGTLKVEYGWDDSNDEPIYIEFGKVDNGVVKLDPKVPNDTLTDVDELEFLLYPRSECMEGYECNTDLPNCTISPSDGKYYLVREGISLFVVENPLFPTKESFYGSIVARSGDEYGVSNIVIYGYFTKATKMNCTEKSGRTAANIDAKAGWNEIYRHRDYIEYKNDEYTTNKSVVNQELKWVLDSYWW